MWNTEMLCRMEYCNMVILVSWKQGSCRVVCRGEWAGRKKWQTSILYYKSHPTQGSIQVWNTNKNTNMNQTSMLNCICIQIWSQSFKMCICQDSIQLQWHMIMPCISPFDNKIVLFLHCFWYVWADSSKNQFCASINFDWSDLRT